MLIEMRAATIWLCLAFLWLIDAGFAFRRHDVRQAMVAGIVAVCFLAAGIYFSATRDRRR
jgi:L-asparagine transporter-like permease